MRMHHSIWCAVFAAFCNLLITEASAQEATLKYSDISVLTKRGGEYQVYVAKDGKQYSIGDWITIQNPSFQDKNTFLHVMKGKSFMTRLMIYAEHSGTSIQIEKITVVNAAEQHGGEKMAVFIARSEGGVYYTVSVEMGLESGEVGIGPAKATLASNAQGKGSNPAPPVNVAAAFGKISDKAVRLDVNAISSFQEGFAIVTKGRSTGVIDARGNFIVPFNQWVFNNFGEQYRNLTEGFVNGSCVVKAIDGDKFGIIDVRGNLIVPCNNLLAFPFDENGLAVVLKEDGYYFVERSGKQQKVPACFRRRWDAGIVGMFYDPTLQEILKKNGVVDVQFTKKRLSIGLTPEGKFSVFDLAGNRTTSLTYGWASHFSEGRAIVQKDDEFGRTKWGYIDETGKVVIPIQFSNKPGRFSEGLAFVMPVDESEFQYAFIDPAGNVQVKFKDVMKRINGSNPDFSFYRDGYALLPYQSYKGKRNFVLIDKQGNNLTDYVNDAIGGINTKVQNIDGMTYHYKNGQLILSGGLLDLKYKTVIPEGSFNKLSPFDPVSNLALASKNNVTGYINRDGEFVILVAPVAKW